MNTRYLALGFALSFAASGCADDTTSTEDAAATMHVREAWMVGGWSWREDSGGDLTSQFMQLNADGTGYRSWSTIRPNISYGFGNESSNDTFTWWSENGALVIDGSRRELVIGPNCRIVKLDGLVFTHYFTGSCPQPSAPLSEPEAKVVGTWTYEDQGRYSSTHLRLKVEADRQVSYYRTFDCCSPSDYTAYFTVDSSNVLHATDIDGKEIFNLTLKWTGDRLSFCDFGDLTDCSTLTRE